MTTAVLVLARTLHIGSAMMLVALPWFVLMVVRPVLREHWGDDGRSFCRSLVKWLWLALVLEAVSGVAWFWLVTAQMSDRSPWGILGADDLKTVLWQTQFGRLWFGRAFLGAALVAALSFVSYQQTLSKAGTSLTNWLFLVLSGSLLLTLAWAGHAAAGIHDAVLHLLADLLHLLLGAIWPTGLVPLACFLLHINDRTRQILTPDRSIQVLQRFSHFSLVAVIALLATGSINAWLMIGSWDALATTTYGRLLLGKIFVVGIMIGLGAINRIYLLPKMKDAPIMLRVLEWTVWAESGLALIVLVIVGVMGTTSPPS